MTYDWIKAWHVIAVISWMAGLLYLPRLFVYHVRATKGSEWSETLKIMERRLYRYIMIPAMIASYVLGVWMFVLTPELLQLGYIWWKILLVGILTITHFKLGSYRVAFAADANRHSEKFYRILNEFPTILMIGIVIMVVVKPTFS